jgi:hypothetical protein
VLLLLLLWPAVQVREEKGVCVERMSICDGNANVMGWWSVRWKFRGACTFLSLPSVVRLDDVPQPYPPACDEDAQTAPLVLRSSWTRFGATGDSA